MPTFAARLRDTRKLRRLTQTQLGDLMHVSKQAVAAWEQGRNQPNASQLAQLCEHLEVDANYLVQGVHTHVSLDALRLAEAYDASSDDVKTLLRKVFGDAADDKKVEQAYGAPPLMPAITRKPK